MKFSSDQEAIEWIENHTVFDMLDEGASVGEPVVVDDRFRCVYGHN